MTLDSSEKLRIYRLKAPAPTELQPVAPSGNVIATDFENKIIKLDSSLEGLYLETCKFPNGKAVQLKRNILNSCLRDGFSFSWFTNKNEFEPYSLVYVPISIEATGLPKQQLIIKDSMWLPASHFMQIAIDVQNAKQHYDQSVAQIKNEFGPKKLTYQISPQIQKEKLDEVERICKEYVEIAQQYQNSVHRLGMADAATEFQRIPQLAMEVHQSYINGRECQRRLSELTAPLTLEQKLFS